MMHKIDFKLSNGKTAEVGFVDQRVYENFVTAIGSEWSKPTDTIFVYIHQDNDWDNVMLSEIVGVSTVSEPWQCNTV